MTGPKIATGPTATAARTERAWQDDARCRQTGDDPDLWHAPDRPAIVAAKGVCAGCPVKAQCLAEAMADPSLTGVWGGTTDDERKSLRTGRPAPTVDDRCGTYSGYSAHRRRAEPPCRACKDVQNTYNRTRKASA